MLSLDGGMDNQSEPTRLTWVASLWAGTEVDWAELVHFFSELENFESGSLHPGLVG